VSAPVLARLRALLSAEAGLAFDESRDPALSAVLARRVAATGSSDATSYLRTVAGPAGAEELQRLLDEATIQETFFHRGEPQIAALRTRILPELLRRASDAGRDLVVWSAGCSTGEEAYTLAMLAAEVRAAHRLSARVSVLGTDVSTAALEVARAGVYRGRTVELAEPAAVARWMEPTADGARRVRPEVAASVRFARHNLVRDPLPLPAGTVDLVVCRHVTIYFAAPTTRSVVGSFAVALAPASWLMLGPTESLWQVSDAFTLEAVGRAFAYRSVAAGGLSRAPRVLPAPASPAARPAGTGARRGQAPSTPAAVPAPAATLARAQAAFDAGDYPSAAAGARAALAGDGELVGAWVLAGLVALNAGDAPAAVTALSKALYLAPQDGYARFLSAVALSRCGRHRQAAAAFGAAAAAIPALPAADLARMLDGAPVAELVQWCLEQADESTMAAQQVERAGRAS